MGCLELGKPMSGTPRHSVALPKPGFLADCKALIRRSHDSGGRSVESE